MTTPAPRVCITRCGLLAEPGDVYCTGCASARDRLAWTALDDEDDERQHAAAERAAVDAAAAAESEPC